MYFSKNRLPYCWTTRMTTNMLRYCVLVVMCGWISIDATKYEHIHRSDSGVKVSTASGRRVNSGPSALYPETREFLDKVKGLATLQDVEDFQETDDNFELVDFGKKNGPFAEDTKSSKPTPGKCKADKKNDPDISSKISPSPNEAVEESRSSKIGVVQNSSDVTESSTEAPTISPDSSGGNSEAPASSQIAGGAEEESRSGSSFISAVEQEMLNPTPPELPPSKADLSKKKRKKKRLEEAPPTKQELENAYKYEVLPPPDNSPVSLDFPASPAAQGEEHLSKHLALPLYCDTCMAIAYQLYLSFRKFADQVRSRPPTESEIYHLVGETCRHERFHEYGMLEVHGQRHITGPGCNRLESEGGVKHSRGPWPKRISERCEELTEDIGELAIHAAWLRERTSPKKLKRLLCFGAPPRDYCPRFGYEDGKAAVAEHRRQKRMETQNEEEPIDAIRRLEREAADAAQQEPAAKDEL